MVWTRQPRHRSQQRLRVSFGPLSVMKRRPSKLSRNTDCALISRRISWMTSPMAGMCSTLRFAVYPPYLACGLSWLWRHSVVTAQGVEVVESGCRRWIDPHWFRGNSYFRLGWEWIKTSFANGWKLIRQVRFTRNHDPDPAMASRKQDEKRRYRFEFQIHTYQYVPG